MKCKVSSIGCDEEYGERIIVMDDDQIGEVSIREMEVNSLDELAALSEDVDRVEVKSCPWEKYDFDLTFICGHL